MATTHIYRIYDTKAESWMSLIQSPNAATAERELREAVNTPNNTFNLYAEDYTMFEVGSYDPDEPLPVIYDTPKSVCQCITLREHAPPAMPFNIPVPNNAGPPTSEYILEAAEALVADAESKRLNGGN